MMLNRKLLLTITILFLTTGFCFAQSNDSIIKGIKTKYQLIHDNLKSYDTTKIDIWDESTEGGEATGYYDGKNIKLIVVIWYGETGKRMLEYYFDNGNLIFAFNADFDYNRPIYWDSTSMKENNDTEIFDPNKTTRKEDRYYFTNQKLIRWLDNAKKEVALRTKESSDIEKELITDASKKLEKFKK